MALEKELDLYSQDTQSFASQRAGHGILIVTLDGRILWTDSRATELCKQMRVSTESLEGALPLRVVKLVQEIGELLQLRNHPKDWEAFNVKRVIKGGETQIFVAGIGFPPRGGSRAGNTGLFTLHWVPLPPT